MLTPMDAELEDVEPFDPEGLLQFDQDVVDDGMQVVVGAERRPQQDEFVAADYGNRVGCRAVRPAMRSATEMRGHRRWRDCNSR